jgi:hypothetical protein
MNYENQLNDIDTLSDNGDIDNDLAAGVPSEDSLMSMVDDSDDDEIVMDSYDEEAEF